MLRVVDVSDVTQDQRDELCATINATGRSADDYRTVFGVGRVGDAWELHMRRILKDDAGVCVVDHTANTVAYVPEVFTVDAVPEWVRCAYYCPLH